MAGESKAGAAIESALPGLGSTYHSAQIRHASIRGYMTRLTTKLGTGATHHTLARGGGTHSIIDLLHSLAAHRSETSKRLAGYSKRQAGLENIARIAESTSSQLSKAAKRSGKNSPLPALDVIVTHGPNGEFILEVGGQAVERPWEYYVMVANEIKKLNGVGAVHEDYERLLAYRVMLSIQQGTPINAEMFVAPQELKAQVFLAFHFTCVFCKRTCLGVWVADTTLEHRIPQSFFTAGHSMLTSGFDSFDNLYPAHRTCNSARGNREFFVWTKNDSFEKLLHEEGTLTYVLGTEAPQKWQELLFYESHRILNEKESAIMAMSYLYQHGGKLPPKWVEYDRYQEDLRNYEEYLPDDWQEKILTYWQDLLGRYGETSEVTIDTGPSASLAAARALSKGASARAGAMLQGLRSSNTGFSLPGKKPKGGLSADVIFEMRPDAAPAEEVLNRLWKDVQNIMAQGAD